MDLHASARLAASPERAFAEVADLATYPEWLSIVQSATLDGDAWLVDLGARVGPFRRTKRVRMVRVEHRPPHAVRFERQETDGQEHSPWVLASEVAPDGDGAVLTVHLHYGGAAWLPGVDLVLRREVSRAGGRLAARLA